MSGGFSVPFAAIGVVSAFFAKENNAALVAAVVFLALGIGAMWFAAFRIWAAERVKVVSLDVSTRREAARLRVAELITEGAGIRNENADDYNPFTLEELNGWRVRAELWHRVVLDTLKTVSAADAEWYRTLNEVPPQQYQWPFRTAQMKMTCNFTRCTTIAL